LKDIMNALKILFQKIYVGRHTLDYLCTKSERTCRTLTSWYRRMMCVAGI